MATSTNQFVGLWQRLSGSQRAVVIVAVLATLGLIGAIFYFGSRPNYAVMFSDLKASDAQAIVEKLKATQVPYELSNNGTTISVPSEQVTELRLQMAASGALATGHVGFDIFDKTSFGATDFTQQVNYQRALEGELARTLEGMKEVETARVHITRSHESVFSEKAEPAKASVMLKLRGRELSAERTEAIVSLLSSAVEGLEPDSVAVMDSDGRLLKGANSKNGIKGTGGSDSLMEARRKFEADSAEQIIALLEPITGPGHVRANVTADIDFNQTEQTEETYDPKSAVIRVQQTSQEQRGLPGSKGGVAGTRANDPTAAPGVQVTGAPTSDGRAATSTTYEISKVTKRTIGNGGKVTRLSVSVLVDKHQEDAGTPDALKQMQELVASAVGSDAARGDQITVRMIPFQQPAASTPPPATWLERHREIVKEGIKYGVLALIALLLMFMVIRPARRALRTASTPADQLLLAAAADEPLALSAGHELTASTLPRTVAEMQAEEAPEPAVLELPRPKESHTAVLRDRVIGYSKDDPAKVAMAVRNWLQD